LKGNWYKDSAKHLGGAITTMITIDRTLLLMSV